MASNFLDLEASVNNSSKDEPTYDEERDFLDDFLAEVHSTTRPVIPNPSMLTASSNVLDSLAAKYGNSSSKKSPTKRLRAVSLTYDSTESQSSHPVLPLLCRSGYNPTLVIPFCQVIELTDQGQENQRVPSLAHAPIVQATARQQAEVSKNWGSWAWGVAKLAPVEGYEQHQLHPGQQQVTAQSSSGLSDREELKEGYWVLVVPRLPDLSQTLDSSLRLKHRASVPRQHYLRHLFVRRDYGVASE
ncbi:hypothetical protein V5O48_014168 [Marasmius crinis-equi]|uniref:Uncharacterized protein n=1 Tax=Marasmius crinis-equi TaxID=585013 RepID=A0ABR3EYF2_9AGAR